MCMCTRCFGQCLEFEVPGHPGLPLTGRDGTVRPDAPVTLDNLGDYVDAVVCTVLVTTCQPQVAAFAAGFADYGDVAALRMFAPGELATLLASDGDVSDALWAPRAVARHIVCQHGYTAQSTQVRCCLLVDGRVGRGPYLGLFMLVPVELLCECACVGWGGAGWGGLGSNLVPLPLTARGDLAPGEAPERWPPCPAIPPPPPPRAPPAPSRTGALPPDGHE